MKKRTGWAYVLLMGFLLAGCDRQTAFHAFRSLSEQGWNRQDTVCFPLSDDRYSPDSRYLRNPLPVERRPNDIPGNSFHDP